MKVFKSYVPQTDGDLSVWAASYKEKMGLLGEALGISPDQVAAQQQAAQDIIDTIVKVEIYKGKLKDAVAFRDLVKQSRLQEIRNMATNIKTLPAYTPNMGKDLGIVTTGQAVDLAVLKPLLAVTSFIGYVNVAFNKQRMLGVRVYGRVRGQQQWNLLGMSKSSPFYDEEPLAEEGKPEIREYKAICFDGQYEIGQESDVASLVYGG